MAHNSTHEIVCCFAQTILFIRVTENVLTVFAQEHVKEHRRTFFTIIWLWHKRSMKSMSLCYGTNGKFKCHNIIGCQNSIIKFEIDMMLAYFIGVIRRFHLKSHLGQRKHDITSCIFSGIHRSNIKKSTFFTGVCCWLSIFRHVKEEKFRFRSNI